MATPDRPRFERVISVSSPGQFMFATDLVAGSKEPLPDHGVVSGVVLGQRPNWDYRLEEFLRKEYPGAKRLYKWRIDEDDPNSRWIEESTPWLGQSGKIAINREFYQYMAGPDLAHVATARFSLHALNSASQAEFELPGYEIFGGLMEIEEIYSRPYELYRGQPFWRGTVRLEGRHPRTPIQLLIHQINLDIQTKGLPVFKDLTYRPPLSIIGPDFVSPDRLRPAT